MDVESERDAITERVKSENDLIHQRMTCLVLFKASYWAPSRLRGRCHWPPYWSHRWSA